MARLEIRLLGSFEVRLDGQIVTSFESNKVRALLATLAAEAPRPQPRERLAEMLWPDWPQQSAMSNLRYALADLRKCIGDREEDGGFLTITRQSVQVNLESDVYIDVLAFDTAVASAEAGDPEGWQRAEACYDRVFLEGFSLADNGDFNEWVLSKRAYYNRKMLKVLDSLAGDSEQEGNYEEGLKHARRALEIEPWWEEGHQRVMRLLALNGERGAALAQYEECKRGLKKELGAEPGEATHRLAVQITADRLARVKDRVEKVAGNSFSAEEQLAMEHLKRPRHNLPAELTSFVGREKEVQEVRERLTSGSERLVTLSGTGGVGKSRLALRAASGLVDNFEDGVVWVGLAPLTDPELVPMAVAKELRLSETPGHSPTELLKDALRTNHLLLVLDNCEHLIEACALLVYDLLRSCPELRILATSRERLGVEGECALRLPSLAAPEAGEALEKSVLAQYEAVRLFIGRAQAVSPGFQLTEENARIIGAICRRLDGIPLAIELAAARVRVLSPAQIEQRLNDVFQLLTGGGRTALPRHQSLRAALDWSYQLLSESEQRLLRELSVFSGGWTLEAAEAVGSVGNVLEGLQKLVDHSLVTVEMGETARFSILETIRQYGHAKLMDAQEEENVRRKHLEYYLVLAEQLEPGLRGRTQIQVLSTLERELPNLRAAMEWGMRSNPEAELRIASALLWLWHIHTRREEGLYWLDQGLVGSDATMIPAPVRARALAAVGTQRVMRYEYPFADARLHESLAIYRQLGEDWKAEKAFVLSWLSNLETCHGDYDQGEKYAEEALVIYREEAKLSVDFCNCLLFLSDNLARRNPDNPRIRILREEFLQQSLAVEDADLIATAYKYLAFVAQYEMDITRAKHLMSLSLKYYQLVRNWEAIEDTYHCLGFYELLVGNYPEAIKNYQMAINIGRKCDQSMFSSVRASLAYAYMVLGEVELANQCLEDALGFVERTGNLEFIADVHVTRSFLACLKGDWERMEEEIQAANCLNKYLGYHTAMGRGFLIKGDWKKAKESFIKALSFEGASLDILAGFSVDGYARIIADIQPEEAVRLFAAVDKRHPLLPNVLFPPERVSRERIQAHLKSVLGEERVNELSVEGQRMSFQDAIDWVIYNECELS